MDGGNRGQMAIKGNLKRRATLFGTGPTLIYQYGQNGAGPLFPVSFRERSCSSKAQRSL
jgi:hypothetical protein